MSSFSRHFCSATASLIRVLSSLTSVRCASRISALLQRRRESSSSMPEPRMSVSCHTQGGAVGRIDRTHLIYSAIDANNKLSHISLQIHTLLKTAQLEPAELANPNCHQPANGDVWKPDQTRLQLSKLSSTDRPLTYKYLWLGCHGQQRAPMAKVYTGIT
ncbi:unnamed protein product [Protopolystoma xenopodis]|uniref:Uncharacterized protein n=1 Tax=Protopolystoma xenopodis TaxID=117903 RepID=A0A448XT50_9PLAT|nr:unnamed protein product [Protopolystoma xenopodis]